MPSDLRIALRTVRRQRSYTLVTILTLALGIGSASSAGGGGASSPPYAPLPEGDHGIAAKYPGDRGIDADPAVLFHDDFESGDMRGKWDNAFQKADIRIADEPANVRGGKRALEFKVPMQKAELSDGI